MRIEEEEIRLSNIIMLFLEIFFYIVIRKLVNNIIIEKGYGLGKYHRSIRSAGGPVRHSHTHIYFSTHYSRQNKVSLLTKLHRLILVTSSTGIEFTIERRSSLSWT